jgi:uncharacterized lipoprotein YmbA
VIRPLIALTMSAGLVACASAPMENYYTLAAPLPERPAADSALSNAGVTVVVTGLVEAVDRPQLVLRVSETRVQILEQQRWAEPLKAAIPRVVAANLARELGSARVTSQSRAPPGDTAYRVALDVQRFDSTPGEGAAIEVAWSIRRVEGSAETSGRSSVKESAAGSGYDALVAAHSRALGAVSREIAQALVAFVARK